MKKIFLAGLCLSLSSWACAGVAGAVFQWDAGSVATKAATKYSGKYSSVNQTDDKCPTIFVVVNEKPPYVNREAPHVMGHGVAGGI